MFTPSGNIALIRNGTQKSIRSFMTIEASQFT